MSRTLSLRVPQGELSRDVIHSYYDYVERKREETPPPTDEGRIHPDLPDANRKWSLEQFDDDPTDVYIWVPVFRDYRAAEAYDRLGEIFPIDTDPEVVCDEATLKEVFEIFKDIKEELKAMGGGPERSDGIEYSPRDREWVMEIQVIALCEFALENGYCISFGW